MITSRMNSPFPHTSLQPIIYESNSSLFDLKFEVCVGVGGGVGGCVRVYIYLSIYI